MFSVVEGGGEWVCVFTWEERVKERKCKHPSIKSSLQQGQNEHRTSKQQRTPRTAADSWGSALIPVLHVSVTGVSANQMYACLEDF